MIDKYKDRPDVQFLTLDIDENPGLIAPYLKEQQLSLIVLPAFSYVSDVFKGSVGIPQIWIVDQQGVVRLKGSGYDSTGKWELGMANAIEQVKGRE